MTELLYYSTPIITECGATVLSCEKDERSGAYKIILDRTMIYPEGGGQPADRGSIVFRPDNSAAEQTVRISDAHTENGSVVHFCDAEIPVGTIVRVILDVDTRLDHAQQHTGEHIVSGLANKLFGAVNVGFHMAADYCTIDFDIPLEQAQLEELERAANAAVRANLSVHTEVTTPEDASTRTLRKKSDKAVGNDKNKKSDKPQNNICEPVLPAKLYELFISTTEKSIPVPAAARILRQRAVSERFCSPMLSITREERGFGSFAEAELPQQCARFKTSFPRLQSSIQPPARNCPPQFANRQTSLHLQKASCAKKAAVLPLPRASVCFQRRNA